MKIIYIDLETTGTDPKKNGIIQIAGTISANGESEDFNFLMCPRNETVYDRTALQKNGKTRGEIATYPHSSEVFPKFIALLSKYVNRFDKADKFYFVGYNSSFDMDFLREWFSQNEEAYFGSWFWYPSLDVLNLAAYYLIGKHHLLPNMKLGTVYEYLLGKPLLEAHDAMADISGTREILNFITSKWFSK